MARSLKVLFRRDPSRDRQEDRIAFEGYQFYWPNGRPVAVGFDAFCKHGQRVLGLGRQLEGCRERLVEMLCYPVHDHETDMTRLAGARIRRFFIERQGTQGRVHFMDGTPTAIVMDLERDEYPVLHWIGLTNLADGQRQWFDLAARAADAARPLAGVPVSMPAAHEVVLS